MNLQRGVGVTAPHALDEGADHVVVLVAAAVVAHGRPVHGPLDSGDIDPAAGRHAERRRLQIGQRAPGIAAGQPDEHIDDPIVQGDGTAKAALVGDGTLDHGPHVVVADRLQGEQQRPGKQRADHGEERVLGGRADEGHPPVLHRGQQRVLLRLVEPVHLVDEQHGLPAGEAELAPGGVDRRADILDAGRDRGQLGEAPPGDIADNLRQRRLPSSGRTPEQQ